uniref:Apple domain-containing protein n=1 Tax=Panagrolaimus sp. ES5 TaxID=591445 RepID=A0AC34FUB9_9BILA
MWIFVFLALICHTTAKIDPEVLKPCFERYDGHKLIHSMPFHSEFKMSQEENCLEFCAQATSRCRSIVYDKISQICHYFMVDGVELRQVAPQRGMAYFQLSDPNCAAAAIANTPSGEDTTTETIPPTVTEDVNGEEIPVMFAPENFPQPPHTSSSQTPSATSETPPTEDEGEIAVDDFANDDNNYMTQRPFKKYHKFDEKIDKTKAIVDEAVIYDDEGNLIQYQTSVSPSSKAENENEQHETSEATFEEHHQNNNNFDDVRVPQDESSTINEQNEKPTVISDDSDYHEQPNVNNNNKGEDDKDYDPVPIQADKESSTLSFIETRLEPTTTFEPEIVPSPATKAFKPKNFEPEIITDPPTTTPDPREEEFKNLQEQMKLLEKEVLQIREEEARKQQKYSPKFEVPKFPPSPLAFMEHSVPSILPEMKVFKVARKEFSEAAAKVEPEIRRSPSKQEKAAVPNIKPLAKAFASALNSDFENEDSDCPKGSSFIWIGVENSDLPKIGDLITKKSDTVEDCMERCKKIRINGHVCNAFGFNEKRMECTYGYEEDMFGVKPTKASDYSTRAFKKLCYPDTMGAFRDCTEFLAFRDYKLDISPKEVFDGLPSGREGVSGCVELCVLSTNFKCKAASFDFSNNQCQLFDKYSLSNPENFKEHKTDLKEARVQRAAINDIKIDTSLTPVRIDFRKLLRA